ncbi:MAG: hypothetical protein ABIJ21_02935 [Nanoarchaeota archaeon]
MNNYWTIISNNLQYGVLVRGVLLFVFDYDRIICVFGSRISSPASL